ncbi:murein biosynthesis integral membrane protein MurJ [Candidatus Tachikawaea gelatinosa]|uniref:Probable lipid II flippase MurJ n=1 Tax=Candidatus Tachikawaea gelatinosa TaxID=1410383 RepID=A0A090AIS6_9ENTR|nr:murein biosynthesis integral membrane protein MurJ [Candidatus Tachikawaea gelatinosa]BAP58308.1 murein flipperse [Candidatus Tachikawaea gelatinosa]
MNLLKSFFLISFATFFSRILGFIRDAIIAHIFGSGSNTDAFFVAFKIPNLLRRIFAEGAFSQAFLPILTIYKKRKGKNKTKIFISYITGLLMLSLIVITVLGIFFSSYIVLITAPGFQNDQKKFILTSLMLKIVFPYIFFISMTSLIASILNTWNYLIIPAFSPCLLNLSIIFCSLFLIPYFNPPILILAWAVFIGGILQLLYQFFFLKKINMCILPKFNLKNREVWDFLKNFCTAVFCVSINQITLLTNTIFASFLDSGSVSWMYYADRLMELPCGILGAGISSILLPLLSNSVSQNNTDQYSNLINWGLKLSILLAFPSAVAIYILAGPLVISLFQYNKFTMFDALMTKHALMAYSLGLIGLILTKILAPAFYSYNDMKTPLRISIITLIITQMMNIIFIKFFKHIGLALSIGLSANVNSILLFLKLIQTKRFYLINGWKIFLLRILIAIIIMIITLYGFLNFYPVWNTGTIFYRLLRLISICIIGGTSYILTLFMLGLKINDFIYKHNN